MKKTITKEEFVNTFADYGRADDFSRAGREAMFEYFEELGAETGVEVEFDCIAICCEFSEYDSTEQWAKDYLTDDQYEDMMEGAEDEEEREELASDYLRKNTLVIEFEGGIIIQAF